MAHDRGRHVLPAVARRYELALDPNTATVRAHIQNMNMACAG